MALSSLAFRRKQMGKIMMMKLLVSGSMMGVIFLASSVSA